MHWGIRAFEYQFSKKICVTDWFVKNNIFNRQTQSDISTLQSLITIDDIREYVLFYMRLYKSTLCQCVINIIRYALIQQYFFLIEKTGKDRRRERDRVLTQAINQNDMVAFWLWRWDVLPIFLRQKTNSILLNVATIPV